MTDLRLMLKLYLFEDGASFVPVVDIYEATCSCGFFPPVCFDFFFFFFSSLATSLRSKPAIGSVRSVLWYSTFQNEAGAAFQRTHFHRFHTGAFTWLQTQSSLLLICICGYSP